MSNCDFGSPCDCSKCSTEDRRETCPGCGFHNVVSTRGVVTISSNRKGVREANLKLPSGEPKDLQCRKCGNVMHGVPYFGEVDEEACAIRLKEERIAAVAVPCSACAKKTEWRLSEGVGPVALTDYNGRQLCKECHVKAVQADTPDPSTKVEKYRFNRQALAWELEKVRLCCSACGTRNYWVLPPQRWKTRCPACYKVGASPVR